MISTFRSVHCTGRNF